MSKKALYLFGDIVVVHDNLIGAVVKTWGGINGYEYDVYVRNFNRIKTFKESEIERYRVRHKYLDEQEMQWQNG